MERIKGDSEHEVIADVKVDGGELHRFLNGGGVEYSAIYVNGVERASETREREGELVEWWNSNHMADYLKP